MYSSLSYMEILEVSISCAIFMEFVDFFFWKPWNLLMLLFYLINFRGVIFSPWFLGISCLVITRLFWPISVQVCAGLSSRLQEYKSENSQLEVLLVSEVKCVLMFPCLLPCVLNAFTCRNNPMWEQCYSIY